MTTKTQHSNSFSTPRITLNDSDEHTNLADKILMSDKVIHGNIYLWTTYLDECLKEFVLLYNFNFFNIATKFHSFISFPYKYDFSEDEIRRHWAFLHAARVRGVIIDEDYYNLYRSRKSKLVENGLKSIELENQVKSGGNTLTNIDINASKEILESNEEKINRTIEEEREKEKKRKERLREIEEQVSIYI